MVVRIRIFGKLYFIDLYVFILRMIVFKNIFVYIYVRFFNDLVYRCLNKVYDLGFIDLGEYWYICIVIFFVDY